MKKQKNKGGRPPSPEPLVKIGRHIRENQLPVTAEEIRDSLDFYRKHKAAFEAEKAAWLIDNENPNSVKIGSQIPGKQDIADM